MSNQIITSLENAVILSEIAANAGALMLANGAEIYRVEDTIERILRSKPNIKDVDVYCTFNVIILSFSYHGEIHSNLRRVKSRTNNLFFIDKINSFSRNFVNGNFTLEEAIEELNSIKLDKNVSKRNKMLGAGIAAGAFSLLLNGSVRELIISFIVSVIAYLLSSFLEEEELGYFVINFLCGAFVSFLTIISRIIFPNILFDVVIISSMMPFLPGITLTSAVRDLMGGDATSGLTGAVLAILISAALALGVSIPISAVDFWGAI